MTGNTYGTVLSGRQLAMLDSLADDGDRETVRGRFVVGNAPHPFHQVRMLSPRQRLCGLPESARVRALANPQGLGRYSGIVASHILGGSHNFSSGGYTYNAYADSFGDFRGQLGVVANVNPHRYGSYGVTGGHWEQVHPLGVDRFDDWMFVWVDMYTRLSGVGVAKPKGPGLDAAKVPVVFRVDVRVKGELIGSGTHQCLPWDMPAAAERVRAAWTSECGDENAVVTYRPA